MDENGKLSVIPVTEISSIILSSALYSYSGEGSELIGNIYNTDKPSENSFNFISVILVLKSGDVNRLCVNHFL